MMKRSLFALNPGAIIVWLTAIAGAAAIIYRFWAGIGAVSNLSDGYPWGLWVAIDIMAGVALASGGFIVAGAVHLLGGKKYHSLARPAVLAAFLGYLMFVLGLIVDMGRPWNMLHLFLGNHQSPLYEIGWCAAMYTFVLFLELLPAVFEKFFMNRAHDLWKRLSPWLVIVMLPVFMYAMTFSIAWTLALTVLLIAWELLMVKGVFKRDAQTPIILISAGVILSFLHQSSLGTLYLMAPHNLNVLWHSPMLPVLFLLSAICAGIGMMTLESMGGGKIMGHDVNLKPLQAFAGYMPALLLLYLAFKVGDLVIQGDWPVLFSGGVPAAMWCLEMGLGVVLPLALYLSTKLTARPAGLFLASFFVVAGVVINRVNVVIMGIEMERWDVYYPSATETLITLGIFAMGLLAFNWLTEELPIYGKA